MTRTFIQHHWQGIVVAFMMAAFAIMASQVNAAGKPPSQIFVPWPKGRPAPEVHLTAGRYSDGGWYIDIKAEGFVFIDLCQAVDGPQAIGHAHVYQAERKIKSAFQPRVSLGRLPAGSHRFSIMLRAQDHRVLVGPNGALSGEIMISVAEEDT